MPASAAYNRRRPASTPQVDGRTDFPARADVRVALRGEMISRSEGLSIFEVGAFTPLVQA
jgi:hypothetical protein